MLAEHVVDDLERSVVLLTVRLVTLFDRLFLFRCRSLLLLLVNLFQERRDDRWMNVR